MKKQMNHVSEPGSFEKPDSASRSGSSQLAGPEEEGSDMEGKNPSETSCHHHLELDSYVRTHGLDVCQRNRTNKAV